ncbi:MAG: hypothetical protein HZA06_05160 [Nitrospirae bacterium]|nr:hypothetical protein [Nitrospirota bacterium]
MKRLLIIIGIIMITAILAAFIPGSYGGRMLEKAKSLGYIEYAPKEAEQLAVVRCSQCHNLDKVTKYCFRCGPPLIVVVHNMKAFVALWQNKFPEQQVPNLTDAEAVAIAQVWSALIGNWEDGWNKSDLIKLLENDKAMLRLLNTPIKERKIEAGLAGKSAPGTYKEVFDDLQQGDKKPKP